MKPRSISYAFSEGREIVRVKVGPDGRSGEAEFFKEDWDELLRLGMSPNLYCIGNSVLAAAQGLDKPIMVARAIIDARPNQRVIYQDGNGFNLRYSNLRVKNKGWSKHADRELLLSANYERQKASRERERIT